MRRRRILGNPSHSNVYHVYSRIINREKRMGFEEREVFQRFLNAHSKMAGIEVLAFAVMPNHFHLLVRVPEPQAAEELVTDSVLLDRLGAVYPALSVGKFAAELSRLRQLGDTASIELFRRQFLDRMHDLSIFVKELKARFSMAYNRENERSGPLWEDRFRSVLLEGDNPSLLLVISTYIDLNPVRGGLVEDPKDYRHCSYACAVAGDRARVSTYGQLLDLPIDSSTRRNTAMAQYRMLLFGRALPSEAKQRAGVPVERVRQVMDSAGHLPPLELLRCRVRYLTDSIALGSSGFLESLFPGGSRVPLGADLGELVILHEIRGTAVFPAEG